MEAVDSPQPRSFITDGIIFVKNDIVLADPDTKEKSKTRKDVKISYISVHIFRQLRKKKQPTAKSFQ